jgi:hypothetical protein
MVGLPAGAATMGAGGSAAPVMTERRKSGKMPADPLGYHRHARLSGSHRSYTPSWSSSEHGSLGIPPDESPALVRVGQWPEPKTYIAFANPPESSSEEHSLAHALSAGHYEASVETLDQPSASLVHAGTSFASHATPTTEQSFHTAFHEEGRAMSPTQRFSGHGSIQTPRKSTVL